MAKTGRQGDSTRAHSHDTVNTEDQARTVEDGGAERTGALFEGIQRFRRESQPLGQGLREWTEQPDTLQVLSGALFGICVLGAAVSLSGIVTTKVLAAIGTPLFLLTVLLLGVVLLRQGATTQDSSSNSWADEGRPPINRRP